MRTREESASATVRVRPRPSTLPAAVEAVLAAPGEPLDIAVRAEMERRFGHDFGDVRVHADTQAAAAARLLDADAFTSGADIVFGEGRYRPDAEDGRRLIAHELVHTLQQGRGAATSLQISAPDADPLEHEAATVATRVVAGEALHPGAVSIAAPAARGRIARQARAALERLPAEVPDSPEAVRALADDIARLLAFDPADDAGRVKRRLARFAPTTREAVATELAGRIPATTASQLRQILTDLLPPGTQPVAAEPGTAPAEPETADLPVTPEAVGTEIGETAELPEEAVVEPEAPDEIPEPMAVPEGPVAEPELAGEVAPPALEGEAAAVEEPVGDARDQAAPPIETSEADGPAEDAADSAPADGTEQEALEAHDEAAAEGVDEGPDDARPTPGMAPGGAAEAEQDARAGGGAPEAGASPAEAAVANEVAGEPLDEAAADAEGEPPSPEQEPELPEQPETEPEVEQETVVEPPAAEMGGEGEAAAGEPVGAEPEGAEDLEPATEAEPEEPADAALAEEEPAAADDAGVAAAAAGGGAPIEEPAEPEPPDMSAADPADAMEAAGNLPPGQSQAVLTSVDAAASRSVGEQRAALAEQPPELDRPTGAPSAAELATEAATAPPTAAPARLQRATELPPAGATRVEPLPAAPPPVAARARAPQIASGPQGELNEDGRRALQASLKALPVHDPALEVGAGPAPAVALEAGADPQRAHEERDKLETAARGAVTDGRREIVKPAGEQQLVPNVPAERLTAAIPAAAPAPAAAPPAAAQATLATDPASILAREKRGDELRTAAKDAAAGMRTKRAEQATTAAEERRQSQEQVTQAVRDSAAQQTTARADARGDVHAERTRWSTAEHELAEGELKKADTTVTDAVGKATTLKTDADKKAATHIETGERDAETARQEGEKQAAAERTRGEKETSGGVLGWLAEKATAFFDEIKANITKAFEIARTAVRSAIEGAKKLAAAAIDLARTAIVSAIRLAGDALIAIGDHLLAGFPGVRDRFRKAINDRVEKAQNAVNALADGLKNTVQKALDLLGKGLDAALGLLEKGLLAMVDVYRAAVAGALKWAQSVVNAFAAFAALMRDVAANPKQWLANLAASAMDGVKNHLWKAFKAAIKQWFSDKVEEVLGIGLTVWNLLKKGGLSLARIGSMAWEAIKAAIPPTLIQIIVEKLISLLIPAAAAIMLIIETLQAAWGTIQRVLEAFERFFAFLKAVRTGKAGPQFATAIAAAAIAVIDFVANWLLKRLRKPAGKIAKKLKEIAKKLGKKLAKVAKGIGKKLFGKGKKPKKLKGKPSKKPKPDKHAQAERRVKAATAFLARQLSRGLPRPIVWVQMQYARARWKVRIRLRDGDDTASLSVEANPREKLPLVKKPKAGEPDVADYRARAEKFLGWIAKHHDIHHILPKSDDFASWWNALRIDYNDPRVTLELPAFLHQAGVHRGYRRLRHELGLDSQKRVVTRLHDAWGIEWLRWLRQRMRDGKIESPTHLRNTAVAVRRRVRDDVNARIDYMLGFFSAVLRYDLRKFRISEGRGAPYRERYRKKMARLVNRLRKANPKKPWIVRAAISDWIKGRHLGAKLSKKQADALFRYWSAKR